MVSVPYYSSPRCFISYTTSFHTVICSVKLTSTLLSVLYNSLSQCYQICVTCFPQCFLFYDIWFPNVTWSITHTFPMVYILGHKLPQYYLFYDTCFPNVTSSMTFTSPMLPVLRHSLFQCFLSCGTRFPGVTCSMTLPFPMISILCYSHLKWYQHM